MQNTDQILLCEHGLRRILLSPAAHDKRKKLCIKHLNVLSASAQISEILTL